VNGADDHEVGIHLADFRLDLAERLLANLIAAGQDHGVGPRQPAEGLAKQTGGQKPAVAERAGRVYGDDIEVASQPAMLEAVVHQENLGAVAADRLGRSGDPVRIDDHRHSRTGLGQFRRLVRVCSRRVGIAHLRVMVCGAHPTSLVPPCQDGRTQPLLAHQAGQPNHQRRLARPARRQIPNAQNRHADPMDPQ